MVSPMRFPTPRVAVLWILALSALGGCQDPNTSFDIDHCRSFLPTAAEPPREPGDLRVMTINMWGITFVSDNIDVRFAALAERLNGDPSIDVVGFQEIWDNGARERLFADLRAEYPFQADFHSAQGRSGLGLVSRHPFAGPIRFHGFTETGDPWVPWNGEWFGGKGIGAVRIKLPSGRESAFVAVTHLHACYEDGAPLACDTDDPFASYRQAQLAEARAFVNEHAGDDPAIILGDFNFTPSSTYFGFLRSRGAPNLFDPGWKFVAEETVPERRIDHIWSRPGKRYAWRPRGSARVTYVEPISAGGGARVPLSDHCAIMATLRRASAG